jgi:hypothetical protein
LNVLVADKHGREAQLVRIGAGADVAGLGLKALCDEQSHAVIERFPRHNMKCEIDNALECEVAAHPCCRVAFMYKLGFKNMIHRASTFKD